MRRAGRIAFTAALVLAGYYAVFGGESSIFEVRRARAELRDARVELDRLRTENDSLKAWADSLENDLWTLERIARGEHGLVGDGEEVVRTDPVLFSDTLESREGEGSGG